MFTHKDIEFRTIFVINCIHERSLRVNNGELLLEENVEATDKAKTLTKLPFQNIQSRATLAACLETLPDVDEYDALMGIEGTAAKIFFKAFYQDNNWHQRRPRTKCDALNATLDIGYTMLFNYIECFVRMFGFDLYVGVYHRLWFKRKSLVCNLMEPFRPIIDKTIRTAWNRKQFSERDFMVQKGEYRLKVDRNGDYCRVFYDALISYKTSVFKYIQSYYRCFMGSKPESQYPSFEI